LTKNNPFITFVYTKFEGYTVGSELAYDSIYQLTGSELVSCLSYILSVMSVSHMRVN